MVSPETIKKIKTSAAIVFASASELSSGAAECVVHDVGSVFLLVCFLDSVSSMCPTVSVCAGLAGSASLSVPAVWCGPYFMTTVVDGASG
jgi:hypothetical protein